MGHGQEFPGFEVPGSDVGLSGFQPLLSEFEGTGEWLWGCRFRGDVPVDLIQGRQDLV